MLLLLSSLDQVESDADTAKKTQVHRIYYFLEQFQINMFNIILKIPFHSNLQVKAILELY